MQADAAVHDAGVVTQRERFRNADHIPPEDATTCARKIAPFPRPPAPGCFGNRTPRVHHDDGQLVLVFRSFEDLDRDVSGLIGPKLRLPDRGTIRELHGLFPLACRSIATFSAVNLKPLHSGMRSAEIG